MLQLFLRADSEMLGTSAGTYDVHSPSLPPSDLWILFSPKLTQGLWDQRNSQPQIQISHRQPAHQGSGKSSKILLGKGWEQCSLETWMQEVGVTGTVWDL